MNQIEQIKAKLKEYKKKVFKKLLLRGVYISAGLLLSVFLLLAVTEYYFYLSAATKTVFLSILFLLFILLLVKSILIPLYKYINYDKEIQDELAAVIIGSYYPDIKDKLINIIQLSQLAAHDALAQANIHKFSNVLIDTDFTKPVKMEENKRFLPYLLIPLTFILLIAIFLPAVISESTPRIVQYNKNFTKTAPFSFHVVSDLDSAFTNEDYTLKVQTIGSIVPEEMYIILGSRKIKMAEKSTKTYEYVFQNMQGSKEFQLEGAGYISSVYQLNVYARPVLRGFSVIVEYPEYLNKSKEEIKNTGKLLIPEGSTLSWVFDAKDTDGLQLSFDTDSTQYSIKKTPQGKFKFKKTFKENTAYQIFLSNTRSRNILPIRYDIEVIKDAYPFIKAHTIADSLHYKYVIVAGSIGDDYGLSSLNLMYTIKAKSGDKKGTIPLKFLHNSTQQNFYYQWMLDSLAEYGSKVTYYVAVADNDGVNGPKTVRSPYFSLEIPDAQEIKKQISNNAVETQKQLSSTIKESSKMSKKIDETIQRLKGKKKLDWQDKKLLEDLLKEKQKLDATLNKLQEQFDKELTQREMLNENEQERIAEKAEELEKLMNDLLDEETKKLYDELQKMLNEKKDLSEFQKTLNELKHKEVNLENELERSLELFKKMKIEMDVDQLVQDLQQMQQAQEQLAKETEKSSKPIDQLRSEQENLQKQLEQISKELDDVQEENKKLKNPGSVPEMSEEKEKIAKEMQKSSEQLKKNDSKESAPHQKKAAEELGKMAKALEESMADADIEMLSENIDNLRDILDNLVRLSYNEEDMMKDFKMVNQRDPRYVELGQEQLKLKDDAKIIEDSLLSLAQRVFQIQSFITREVSEMNRYMDKSLSAIKERNKGEAASMQQFAMTSMNNLALLLSDILNQMQMQMMSAKGIGKPEKSPGTSMSQLQQELNKQMSELKKSGKEGKEMSEQLARLAAQQEQIRKAMQEMEKKANGNLGNSSKLKDIAKKMEETEEDLVNKRISEQTIQRQRDILNRLLEAESAMREREQEEKREAQHAKENVNTVPKEFQEYLKLKQQEMELLKTVPLRLNPYYKSEVNKYFDRINN